MKRSSIASTLDSADSKTTCMIQITKTSQVYLLDIARCWQSLLNCSYLRATPKVHWSFRRDLVVASREAAFTVFILAFSSSPAFNIDSAKVKRRIKVGEIRSRKWVKAVPMYKVTCQQRTIKTSYHPDSPDGKENKTQTTSARVADRFLQMNWFFFCLRLLECTGV